MMNIRLKEASTATPQNPQVHLSSCPQPELNLIRKPRYFVAAVPAGQEHQTSRLDREIDTIVSILDELITFHGVYHVKLHFNSSQAVIWQVDDPYRYRLLSILDLLDPDSCLAYPRHTYPTSAQVEQSAIRPILERWKLLRKDAGIAYLRSASLNIFNGMVGLSFSSDLVENRWLFLFQIDDENGGIYQRNTDRQWQRMSSDY